MHQICQVLQCEVGGLGGILAGGLAVFVKVSRQHTKVTKVHKACLVCQLTVETLDHVHGGEVGGELHAHPQIADQGAQQILGLLGSAPGKALHGTTAVTAGLGTGLALDQSDLGVILIHHSPDGPVNVATLAVKGRVDVIGQRINVLPKAGGQDVVYVVKVLGGVGNGAGSHSGLGVSGFHGYSSAVGENAVLIGMLLQIHVVLGVGLVVAPGPPAVWLIPNFIQLDAACKVLGSGGNIVEPTLHFLLGADGWTAYSTEYGFCQVCVKRIAIAQIQPGLHTSCADIVHNGIQPGEVVNTLFLFGTGPAGLDTDPLYANGGQLVISLVGIKGVSVQLFKADTQPGEGDLVSTDHRQLLIKNQSFHSKTSLVFL